MNDTTRFLDGRQRRDRRGKELNRKVREFIYDLAASGKEFSLYDIAAKVHHDDKNSLNMISMNLRGAEIAGFLVQVERRKVQRTVDPAEWIAGDVVRSSSTVLFYRGSPQILKGGTQR